MNSAFRCFVCSWTNISIERNLGENLEIPRDLWPFHDLRSGRLSVFFVSRKRRSQSLEALAGEFPFFLNEKRRLVKIMSEYHDTIYNAGSCNLKMSEHGQKKTATSTIFIFWDGCGGAWRFQSLCEQQVFSSSSWSRNEPRHFFLEKDAHRKFYKEEMCSKHTNSIIAVV